MSAAAPKWQITGEYFENCNCTVVCPCLISTAPQLTSRPTEGHCAVMFAFHIDHGRFGDVVLDGLNVALIAFTPGPMADGNWKIGAYLDEHADTRQEAALGAIFGGAAGGPIGALAPLVGQNLGAKRVPIAYQVNGKRRSVEIPGIMHMAVIPLPTGHPAGEIWAAAGHPFNPDRLAMASGEPGSTFADHGMRWDNSDRNGHYAPIQWAN
jgi:hypothetical protein